MSVKHYKIISQELNLQEKQVQATAKLLEEDATIPFIARYRKEITNSLDEVAITKIRDRLKQLQELDKRKDAIIKSLTERDLLSTNLKNSIEQADSLTLLEDIYLPYRQKKTTRAAKARDKGLAPLAEELLKQQKGNNPETIAIGYINKEKAVNSLEEALAGARDIIAEQIAEDLPTRQRLRELFFTQAALNSQVVKGQEEAGNKFRDWFNWSEKISTAPSHRILALFRGEKDGFLKITLEPDLTQAIDIIEKIWLKAPSPSLEQLSLAIKDSYKRLLLPSLSNELRNMLKERADLEAVKVFADNVYELLMAPPLGKQIVLAIDPAFRTGCKIVVLDEQGKLLIDTVIYPELGSNAQQTAATTIKELVNKFSVKAIAIGNGTASRETESFIRGLQLDPKIIIEIVNESGASVYSASEVAREEFPDKDITVRGAVSIGRRLIDPLAELVKIDPKAIGVGQYQHDVEQNLLQTTLDDTVISCVNSIGVEVNTASKELLTYVSGLNKTLANNIIKHRNTYGAFKNREELKKIPRLGPKAFEQCAGFLRIRNSDNPLDASAVHPERYKLVEKIAQDLDVNVKDLISKPQLHSKIKLESYVSEEVGLPTLQDIVQELAKPGRDPRKKFTTFSFADGINNIKDLKAGQKLPGIITNVTDFGAFVDLGVHQDGLIHISELADEFVSKPQSIVKVGQKVEVTVIAVDQQRNRISLSLRKQPGILKDNLANKSTNTKKKDSLNNNSWFFKALNKN